MLIDLKRHEERIEEFSTKAIRVTEWLKSDIGARVFRQSAGAADRTADPGKVKRIARLLLYGALSSGGEKNDQLLVQQVSEFTRIAEILTDTDVFVLRAIYLSQRAVIEKYRELNGLGGDSLDRRLQDEWAQAVFAQWKETSFTDPSRFVRFVDVLSALPRLEAQGLIGRTTSQVVTADISSTPFGLLDLGALFVEQALKYGDRLESEVRPRPRLEPGSDPTALESGEPIELCPPIRRVRSAAQMMSRLFRSSRNRRRSPQEWKPGPARVESSIHCA